MNILSIKEVPKQTALPEPHRAMCRILRYKTPLKILHHASKKPLLKECVRDKA